MHPFPTRSAAHVHRIVYVRHGRYRIGWKSRLRDRLRCTSRPARILRRLAATTQSGTPQLPLARWHQRVTTTGARPPPSASGVIRGLSTRSGEGCDLWPRGRPPRNPKLKPRRWPAAETPGKRSCPSRPPTALASGSLPGEETCPSWPETVDISRSRHVHRRDPLAGVARGRRRPPTSRRAGDSDRSMAHSHSGLGWKVRRHRQTASSTPTCRVTRRAA